jgi:putative metalloenzyme radical SAM/SPASM domain maturase
MANTLTERRTAREEKLRSGGSFPSRLFVELTTECNLRCGMCVKQGEGGGIAEGSMSADTFNALAPVFPHLEALVLNGVGESLLHPDLEYFIQTAKKSLPGKAWVGFQTNGMLIDRGRAASLVAAGLDRICLSIDSVSRDSFSSLRQGGELSTVEAAFASLRSAKKRYLRADFRTGIEFVLMRDNLAELPAVLRWAARQGASFALVTQLLPYHKDVVSQAAFDTNTAGAISVYERWRRKAEAEGVDMRRYFEAFMKYRKTGEDMKMIGFVEKMKDDAVSQGITLHLERLFRRDDAWFQKVEHYFEEARRVAEGEGIHITLPETAPRNTRKCEFVEGNGAFISWNGDVHPCYFLWHHYRCYVGGWEKRVRPWVFGNLREKDILGIWNAQACRSFREDVLRYQFPFCFDCSFALCDYVQGEDFEQDCYVGSVPCGACLWCTGLFHCLQ